ncbi:l,D-transpeptidase catalytic domain [Mariprofundus micogutta]|uniref:L,D-transpeptidase catalytic domain n=1 Tax=Mariprofundus micogutta TaxID=1921010 RepID=A0A1L8CMF6_9PROT|nr:L,D-transpeptidase family protein [Mariprofundus micogutta]GAV20093.1 l,D-transpeptidase catalytic domain [Mariprofundus micogutta]
MKKPCNIMRASFVVLLLLLMSAQAFADEQMNYVSQVLKDGNHEVVRSMHAQERTILRATAALKSDRPGQALALLASAKEQDPLVALLQAEAHRIQAVDAMKQAGSYSDDTNKQGQLLASADLGLGEANARLYSFIDKLNQDAGDPVDILLPGTGVANVFMFDKARNRMFLYESDGNGGLRKIADEYVVTGSEQGDKKVQGDGKTPNGIYRFISKLDGHELAPRYGPVAFPIDYPNELDQLHNKTGNGIWLHGYPLDVLRRPPQDTRGCFSISNNRLVEVANHVKLKRSWVIVGENFEFDQQDKKRALLESVRKAIETWRSDWTSLNSTSYLSHYHAKFRSGERDLAAWKHYKRRVNANKSFIEVRFDNMTVMHDPNRWSEGEMVVAEFDQQYRSSNYADQGRKRLYLARDSESQPWKILLEETLNQ